MAQVITFTNQKGGVAKTTSAVNTADILSNKGFKVLLIDLDGQGHIAHSLGVFRDQREALAVTIFECLTERKSLKRAVLIINKNLHIVPANSRLKTLAKTTSMYTPDGYHILEDLIKQVTEEYDYIVIDTPANLGFETISALVATDLVVIPVGASEKDIDGIEELFGHIKGALRPNPNLKLAGLLITKHSPRTVNGKMLEKFLREEMAPRLQTKVFESTISERVAFREADIEGKALREYDPKNEGVSQYEKFVEELIKDAETKL